MKKVKNDEMIDRLINLGVFEDDEDFPVIISTVNGLFIKGQKSRVLANLTMMFNSMLEDETITEEQIDDICRLSKINTNKPETLLSLLEELKKEIEEKIKGEE